MAIAMANRTAIVPATTINVAPHEQGSSLIDLISQARYNAVPFAAPKHSLRTTEACLVRDVLEMVQGHPSNSFTWDEKSQSFYSDHGVHLSHLSRTSLNCLLNRFIRASSSLRRIDAFVKRVASASCSTGPIHLQAPPTLQAFANTVSLQLGHLRNSALERELQAVAGGAGTSITLLSLVSNLSWVCAGADFLEQVVRDAVPHNDILRENGIPVGELSAHILSFLYSKMSDYCLLEDGEEEPYGTLIALFAGSLQPLIESLNLWLLEGVLDDPFGELFFYANQSIAIEDAAFWQNGFQLRYFNHNERKADDPSYLIGSNRKDSQELACPSFLQHIARAILSAGKSLQLLQHVQREGTIDNSSTDMALSPSSFLPLMPGFRSSAKQQKVLAGWEKKFQPRVDLGSKANTFSSLWHQWNIQNSDNRNSSPSTAMNANGNVLSDESEQVTLCIKKNSDSIIPLTDNTELKASRNALCLSRASVLPPLNDEDVHKAVFADSNASSTTESSNSVLVLTEDTNITDNAIKGSISKHCTSLEGTDFSNGSACGSLIVKHVNTDFMAMERLFPHPTALTSVKEGWNLFSPHPAQQRSKFSAILFECLERLELKVTPIPQILVQECLIKSIQKQVDSVGKQVLNRLMGEWRLMEELSILRAVYLIGSGDLLQQFSSVLFNKLDRGEPWDDFYELNTMLQESVRSSADGVLLTALDSLVVTVQSRSNSSPEQASGPVPLHFPGRNLTCGIDTLDNLFFFYKVAWPLELIIDRNAIKKYNQVMAFLFKVKRAKFALDKACRWMWKDGGADATNLKQQLLLQQKLMHFVNTLHQYVMDRVLYSAWVELCEGMESARSLDEVIACHDAYLISIQRQCLVAPDKLWALISSRVKTILSLALDFYSIQRTLCGGGAAPAIKARCQIEIERVGRQFDECIVFLLRVLSFKLNVGHFPHLAELVTRINYNYYYISESGHLLTPLPEVNGRRGSQGKVPGIN